MGGTVKFIRNDGNATDYLWTCVTDDVFDHDSVHTVRHFARKSLLLPHLQMTISEFTMAARLIQKLCVLLPTAKGLYTDL